jgi:hypothetical protein
MNRHEAKAILKDEFAKLAALSYRELVACLLDRKERFDVAGPSGARYHVELEASWDDVPEGNLRIVGTIDDGGWRRLLPLAEVAIRAADGSFAGN